ncbi:PHD and RING finger domain-containing protein 1 [Caerostris darwini]|uniref:PHD and RING finger domain-containing protein 1 n=1 Tax=Caerostris darwini TaxID=1538125 RepID=A0AAV4VWI4_9ARAC|nr:PHD and RING finger domain-containing protein 1 [Caerostris darwini]
MASSKDSRDLSSDEEIVHVVRKHKKKPKNIFSSSDSEDEDSDIEIKRKVNRKPIQFESEDESNDNKVNSCNSNVKNSTEVSNDLSDNEQTEKCAICLSKFLGQDIATPETCDHVFCLGCLQQWAKNVNTCPIDRLKFNLILIRHHKEKKIAKTLYVNNSVLSSHSDSDTDSVMIDSFEDFMPAFEILPNFEPFSAVDCCDLCGRDKNESACLRCHSCGNLYHEYCVHSPLGSTSSDAWKCHKCENNFILNFASSLRPHRSLSTETRTTTPITPPCINRHRSLNQNLLITKSIFRSIRSSSDSSDEETNANRSVPSRLFQNSIVSSATKSKFPLLRKRRNELLRSRSQALVSAATSAAPDSSFYDADSDYEYRVSTPIPNFDVVGSILESQTLLHSPDVLTLRRDGTVLRNSKTKNDATAVTPPPSLSDDSSQSSLPSSSSLNNDIKLPLLDSFIAKQRPMNPAQSNSSKYSGGAPKQAYSCSSSGTTLQRSANYEDSSTPRPINSANSNERFGNEHCPPVVQRNFCSTSTAEDMKKDVRASKSHHSEDEVDIYSDIESVGEEEGEIVESIKIAFKCDDTQINNPNDSSDSSDNDLIIDEDQQAEEDNEKTKEIDEPQANEVACESDESNISSNVASEDDDQLRIDTNPPNKSDSCIENSNEACYKSSGESSQEAFQNEESNNSKAAVKNESSFKNESDSEVEPSKNESDSEVDPSKNESDSEVDPSKNESDSDLDLHENDDENSLNNVNKRLQDITDHQENDEILLNSTKKICQDNLNTSCTNIKSPKSCREESNEEFEMQCENSVSNENSGYYDNSCIEEVSNMETENTCDSVSQTGETENLIVSNHSNLSDPASQESNLNFQSDKNLNFSFVQDQQNTTTTNSSNIIQENKQNEEKSELIDICSDIVLKSDDEDNLDSLENASTPCLDENLDGQLENSPPPDESFENGQDFEVSSPNHLEYDYEKVNVVMDEKNESNLNVESPGKDPKKNKLPLRIEDISETGNDIIVCGFQGNSSTNSTEKDLNEVVQKIDHFSSNHNDVSEEVTVLSVEHNKQETSHSNQSFEDQEEGEIIEERPVHRCKKRKDRLRDDTGEYGEFAPRINISNLPRIPKLKRDRDKDSIPETVSFENKRTSVLSRVDLGGVDISWKRLSKHTRERSYRDGRPKDERLLYRERESRNKDKSDTSRKSDSKNSERRREEKKLESEKSKTDYDSRSRKVDKNKSEDRNYSDREKRKSRKEKHSKDKHTKEKKDKHEKSKHSKGEDKYEREKLKEELRYERDLRYEKEERFERLVYEKGKFKEKEHKSKHKDRKNENSKSGKDHSREKHKHIHSSDHFSDKQREREVRKIDDKLKIVVEQKESRKEKSKHKERKEAKHEKKQVLQRKVENERSPYAELTSIESKEIFAKGDSIIINVNFNRASSPKINALPDGCESNLKDKKILSEDMELDKSLGPDENKVKSKHSSTDKSKNSLDCTTIKRPATPPEKNPVLSVSESYWQGGDDPDDNNSPESEKSVQEICEENGNDTGSANEFEANNFSNSCSSPEVQIVASVPKENNPVIEETSFVSDKDVNSNISKESENFSTKRRSPRSPSPPSPADNDSYDPCEPTTSPSPPPMPSAPPLPTINPKPPPSPELPPLPPEPEPIDVREDSRNIKPSTSSDFSNVSTVLVSSVVQPITVHSQTSMASPISVQSMLLPPSFMSHVSSAASNLPGMSNLVPPRNGAFQMGNVMLPTNHVQQVMRGSFMPHMHGNSTLPPPPNPPNMSHMSSVPPPPPPPAGMTLLSQPRHPQLNIQPPLTPNSLLQSLTMAHGMAPPPMQMIHHLPPIFLVFLQIINLPSCVQHKINPQVFLQALRINLFQDWCFHKTKL